MPESSASHRQLITWKEFLSVWLRVAALSFGGPAAQIAVMHRIIVDEKRWIDEQPFLHALNYCMLLPGPEACELAIYIGWLMRGMLGGLIAGTLFVLPGFVSLLVLSILYAEYQELPLTQAIVFGLQGAILAVVLEAVVRIGKRVLKNGPMIAIAATAFIAIFFFRLPFPLIIVGAGLIGLLGGLWRPDLFHVIRSKDTATLGSHVIDYEAPHTKPNLARTLSILLAGLVLWVGPLAAMRTSLGERHVFTQEGFFFSKVSLVTFGGAYAVLPYVAAESEHTYGWVDHKEMMTGIGLGETTPGPLIQVVQFVAFLGAYKQHADLSPLAAGVIGSLIVNWVTYLPCFLWIFVGGPYIERLRGNRLLSCALSAITAAVVGVILNLAIWFAMKALLGKLEDATYGPISVYIPTQPHFSWGTLLLFAGSAIAIFRFHRNLFEVLAVAVATGAVMWWSGVR